MSNTEDRLKRYYPSTIPPITTAASTPKLPTLQRMIEPLPLRYGEVNQDEAEASSILVALSNHHTTSQSPLLDNNTSRRTSLSSTRTMSIHSLIDGTQQASPHFVPPLHPHPPPPQEPFPTGRRISVSSNASHGRPSPPQSYHSHIPYHNNNHYRDHNNRHNSSSVGIQPSQHPYDTSATHHPRGIQHSRSFRQVVANQHPYSHSYSPELPSLRCSNNMKRIAKPHPNAALQAYISYKIYRDIMHKSAAMKQQQPPIVGPPRYISPQRQSFPPPPHQPRQLHVSPPTSPPIEHQQNKLIMQQPLTAFLRTKNDLIVSSQSSKNDPRQHRQKQQRSSPSSPLPQQQQLAPLQQRYNQPTSANRDIHPTFK